MPACSRQSLRRLGAIAALLAAASCRPDAAGCLRCGTVVVAATGEPSHLLPPLVVETVGRDISDQIFERLADLAPGAAPIDTGAYRPALAQRWERVDSVSWRFHLRDGARWQDGRPVTAADVVFSFEAFGDSVLDAPARPYLAGQLAVTAEDSATVLVRFARPSPESLYDATYHVRIIPEHIWGGVPRGRWPADTAVAHLVGSGPYRVAEWRRGEFVRLVADTAGRRAADLPPIRTAVWRFTDDPDAALNLVLGREADLLETAGRPENATRAARDSAVRLEPYPSATYGFLGFRVRGRSTDPVHPIFGDAATRRALALAVDRDALARSAFGREAKAPPGPMSQLLWIWDDRIRTLPFDAVAAARALDQAGWRADSAGVRRRGTKALAFDILVPGTSPTRRQLAVALQAMWQAVGAAVTVTAVDFPVFQERLGRGQFDSYIGAWLDEPSPRGLAEQWTRAGWDALNYGHWSSPAFDTLFARAARATAVDSARALYREAMDTLNAEAPAIFLYAPANLAVVSKRMEGVEIDPYSWASG
ncbi:MAG TPA: peptide ABC transporter substrate-binding protein, partial [Gemmatimonadales bacterium]|nr:peptide ABC transporter substrate-binding protein [Gemmatimonadales bacterium]